MRDLNKQIKKRKKGKNERLKTDWEFKKFTLKYPAELPRGLSKHLTYHCSYPRFDP